MIHGICYHRDISSTIVVGIDNHSKPGNMMDTMTQPSISEQPLEDGEISDEGWRVRYWIFNDGCIHGGHIVTGYK